MADPHGFALSHSGFSANSRPDGTCHFGFILNYGSEDGAYRPFKRAQSRMHQPTAANTQDPREHARWNVFLSAALIVGAVSTPVRIRNISEMGAQLDGRNLPEEGTVLELRRGALVATGCIAWQSESYCGVRFQRPIEIGPWVKRVEHAGQHRVDAVVAALRAGADVSNQQAPTAGLDQLCLELCRVSEDLRCLWNLLKSCCAWTLRFRGSDD